MFFLGTLFCAAFDNYPSSAQISTIKIVVPFPAGGATDILARILTDEISRSRGVMAIIENRPGAGSVIGTEAVARATPDGTTLLMNANSFVINPNLRKVSYDPFGDFEPICYLASTPMFIVVGAESPYRTLVEFFEAARAKPRQLTLASLGPATAQHIAIELLKRLAAVELTFVPYSGNVPAINALLGGHVTSSLANYPDVAEHIRAGRLRALATTARMRIDPFPNVPTVTELGFKDYEAEVWLGLVAPARTPLHITSQIASWFSAAVDAPGVKVRLAAQGLFAKTICGAEFGTFLRAEHDQYLRVIREANIRGE
jgi:tripartite-type tricarboxylate transporter receptor subunit TctC